MASHLAHPDTLTHGLVDDCPRCSQHATTGLHSLDAEHIGAFWRHMVAVERHDDGRYRSENERRFCMTLREHWLFLQRHVPEIDPDTWPLRTKGYVSPLLGGRLHGGRTWEEHCRLAGEPEGRDTGLHRDSMG
jgi:hypothetical protein